MNFSDQTRTDREYRSYRAATFPHTKNAVEVEQDPGNPIPVSASDNLDPPTGYTRLQSFGQVTAVASGSETNIINQTYTDDAYLYFINVGGTNKAKYRVYLNLVQIDEMVTYYTNISESYFNFGKYGIKLVATDNIKITVEHVRPYTGDFFCKLNGITK